MSEKLIVVSDLHLWGSVDPLYRALLTFIDQRLTPGDKFFIVGDLFDLYVGNKVVFYERYHELIEKIQGLGEKNIEVFYVEGNHDFHLESLFEDYPHVKIYSDSFHYEWNEKKFHFCHGDKINWRDFGYLFLRFMTRNLVSQCVLDAMPGNVIDKIGRGMANASRGYHTTANNEVVQLFRNYACEQISNGYDFVIMGHSHYFDEMRFRVENHEGQYINVGYPRVHKKFFQLSRTDSFFILKDWEEFTLTTTRAPNKSI